MLKEYYDIPLTAKSLLLSRPAVGLRAMITNAGHENRTCDYDWHGLKRGREPFVLLQYTLAGEGALVYEGRAYTLQPGDLMQLCIPHDHRYYLPDGGRWEFFYLCLNGREVLRMIREMIHRVGPVLHVAADAPLVRQIAQSVDSALRDEVRTPWAASRLAYALVTELGELALPGRRENTAAPRSDAIQAALDFAQVHLSEPIGVDDLAGAAGLSRFHFSRLFRQSEGLPPGEYLAAERLQLAGELLQKTDLDVQQVARRCGYCDASYFCKSFRRQFGISPGAFRRRGMY